MRTLFKKSLLFAGLLLITFIFSSCNMNKAVVSDIDKTLPAMGKINLKQYWEYQKALKLGPQITEVSDESFKDLYMSIDSVRFIIGQDVLVNPEIKVIRANAYEYFLVNYKITSHDVGIDQENIEVYTITDSKGIMVKLFKLNDDSVAVERNNILVFFKNTDKKIGTGGDMGMLAGGDDTKPESEANGVLIGLRSKRKVENGILGGATYRTIWISLNKEGRMDIYEVPDILFPRNVFYTLSVTREENIDVVSESLVIKNTEGQVISKEEVAPKNVSRFSNLTFISNDYLSVESRLSDNKGEGPFQYYSTKNVDRKSLGVNTKLSDIFGNEGKTIFEASAKDEVSSKGKDTVILQDINDSSFILNRSNGRWVYSGRLNSSEDPLDFVTFTLRLNENIKLYRYDSLIPRWSVIKAKMPNAVDAVSSPENFFTVVKTSNNLIVYKKENGELSGLPIAIIPIGEDETIVMNEWARGSYVYDWGSLVKRLGKPVDVRN
ncbi:MAG: hypothetical protein QMB63_01945 [Clostridiaceae bacterium]